ncbi:hypothetical protein ABZT34_05745 [Streptomyces sp. NPDC005329]|uniref:hypothetical protein n=1 Tax=Streptomyces sp. NPDC005329 TaxID=3157034 RepID=UPI0033BB6ED5
MPPPVLQFAVEFVVSHRFRLERDPRTARAVRGLDRLADLDELLEQGRLRERLRGERAALMTTPTWAPSGPPVPVGAARPAPTAPDGRAPPP